MGTESTVLIKYRLCVCVWSFMSSCTSSSACKVFSPLFSTGDPGEVGDAGDEGRLGKPGPPGHQGLYDIIIVPINTKSVTEGFKKLLLSGDSIFWTGKFSQAPSSSVPVPDECRTLRKLRVISDEERIKNYTTSTAIKCHKNHRIVHAEPKEKVSLSEWVPGRTPFWMLRSLSHPQNL